MSPNTDSQGQPADRQRTPNTVRQLGARFLDVALVIYLIALAISVGAATLGIHTEIGQRAAAALLIIPAALPGLIFAIFYFVFLVSSLASAPLIRFSNCLSALQRNWQNLLASVLLLAVLCAIIAVTTA